MLAASLAAGTSASQGITKLAVDSLGEIDELVRIEGGFLFPAEYADRVRDHPEVRAAGLEVLPLFFSNAAVTGPDGASEPDTVVFGIPPERLAVLGSFEVVEGSAAFPPPEGSVVVNERLARTLQVGVGDGIAVNVVTVPDPLVPRVEFVNGTLTSPAEPPLGLPGDPALARAEHVFEVEPRHHAILVALAWQPGQAGADLDLAVEGPGGAGGADADGGVGSPDVPAVVGVRDPPPGTWTATVTGEGAAEVPYSLVILRFELTYDVDELARAAERFETLQERFPDAAEQLDTRRRTTRNVTIAGIVSDDVGPGGMFRSPNVYAPLDVVQEWLDRPGDTNTLAVSNPGGPGEGRATTDAAMAALNASLARLALDVDEPPAQALFAEPTKAQFVDRAEESGRQFTQFLVTLSTFTILAGILLVVNIFGMLAEERRQELAVSRALGLRRRDLVMGTTIEGMVYAAPGAVVGAFAGIGLAWVLITAVNRFIAESSDIALPFIVDAWDVPVAILATLAAVLAASVATGVWLSRLHIATALKRLPDPPGNRRTIAGVALLLAGSAGTLLAAWLVNYTLGVVGPSMVLAGAALLTTRRLGETNARALAGALVIAYCLWTIPMFDVPDGQAQVVGPVRAVILVLAAVAALLNLPGLPRFLRGVGRRFRRRSPEVMTALAYPVHRRLRTGLTATMFALVLLVLALFSTFFATFQPDVDREAGGYDVYASTTDPAPTLAALSADPAPAVLDDVELADALIEEAVFGGRAVRIDGQRPQYQGPPIDWVYGIGDGFAANNGYELVHRHAAFETDRDAYAAVAGDARPPGADGWVVVGRIYDLDPTGRPGAITDDSVVTLRSAGGERRFAVAGVQAQFYLGGVFMDRATAEALYPAHGGAYLIRVVDGADPGEVARGLERAYADAGMEAESIADATQDLQAQNRQFLLVLQVFLGIGLVIGVASLGIVMAKAAHEREQELGVLRALGVPARGLDRSLLAEAAFTATLGIVPGVVMGVAVAFAFHQGFLADEGVPFRVPWLDILVMSGVTYLAGVLSSIPAARRARRMDVAQAVRVQL